MTAYGRASLATPLGKFTIEIHSVNRRYLEVSTFLSREWIRFDPEIKKWISEKIARGAVTVRVSIVPEKESPFVVTPNLSLALQLKSAWDQIAKALDLKEGFDLKMLAREPGILLYEENIPAENEYQESLKRVVEHALDELVKMRSREGKALESDILKRLKFLQEAIDRINLKVSGATDKYRQKLMARLEEILPEHVENEERVLREIALFAEKVDISEEITRFRSHLSQFEKLLNEDKAVGKTLDFLIQELNREANTIGSKSSEIEIIKTVLEIKSELEKTREQIQNIE